MSKRTRQVADAIQRTLGSVIQNEMKDPRVGFATVVSVDMSADLQHATVHISVLGDDVQQIETMQGLHRARGFLRRRVAEELRHLRTVPELHLHHDTSLEYSMHIDQVLREVEHERMVNPPDLDDTDDTDDTDTEDDDTPDTPDSPDAAHANRPGQEL